MPDFIAEAKKIEEEICSIRESIHRNPEMGNEEYETAKLIENFLNSNNIATKRITETSVLGVLDTGKSGKTVAFRADIDALPVEEKTGVPFASCKSGVMHACGHDVHTSALLGAAKILSLHSDDLSGKILFMFEADEEGSGNAHAFVNSGCLDEADAVFGLHVSSELPSGVVGIRYGKFYAASNMFDVKFFGKSCHGAEPENGIDALYTAASVCSRLKKLPEKFADKSVVTVGRFNSGTVRNVISDEAEINGIIRTLGAENRALMLSEVEKVIDEECAKTGCIADKHFMGSYDGVTNHDNETAFVHLTAKRLFGNEDVALIEKPTMTSEDFGVYLDKVPGCFFHIGAGNSAGLHNAAFIPDTNCLMRAVALHSAIAYGFLTE